MISIQTNVNSLVAQQNLSVNSAFQSKTIAQLTSGYRINQSGDDAAGLAVANQFRSTVAELTQGVANGNDATAQLQIMDGGISNISSILDRLKTLATQSASGTFTGNRATLNSEFQNALSEVDRQAQSIGLNTGGLFAKNLDVYMGTGSGSQTVQNGVVTLGLTNSAVDSQALGMKGMEAVGGTADLGTGNSSVASIVANGVNTSTEAAPGYATFTFSGAGYSDAGKVKVQVNLSSVSDTTSLVSALNNAISGAGSGSPQALAFGRAGIVASVVTDSSGQHLGFTSSTSTFQVQTGDKMSNAMLGKFKEVTTSSEGADITTNVLGGITAAMTAPTTTLFAPQSTGVVVRIQGSGLAAPVDLHIAATAGQVSDAVTSLEGQVSSNAQLSAAGISLTVVNNGQGNQFQFTSATGESLNVVATGDATNQLGLGSFVTSGAATSAVDYRTITSLAVYDPTATHNDQATMQFSINGAAATALTVYLTGGNAAASTVKTSVIANPEIIAGLNDAVSFKVDGITVAGNLTGTTNGVVTGAGAPVYAAFTAATSGAATGTAAPTVLTTNNNMTFSLAVDGGPTQVFTLAANTYTAGNNVVVGSYANVINNMLVAAHAGATADEVGGLIKFTSNSTGLNSSVNLTDGAASTTKTALGATATFTATLFATTNNGANVFTVLANGISTTVTMTHDDTTVQDLVNDINAVAHASFTAVVNGSSVQLVAAATGAAISIKATSGSLNVATDLHLVSGTAYITGDDSVLTTLKLNTQNGIKSGANGNNQFTISSDQHSGPTTITITPAADGTGLLLANAINAQLQAAGLNNYVADAVLHGGFGTTTTGIVASIVGGALTFSSSTVGSGSWVRLDAPPLVNGQVSSALTNMNIVAGLGTGTSATAAGLATQLQNLINTATGVTGPTLGDVHATVSVNADNSISITNDNKGSGHTLTVLAGTAATTPVTNTDYPLAVSFLGTNAVTAGKDRTGDDLAANLNQQFAANTTLQKAQLTASFATGQLTIASTNNTNFRVSSGTTAAATMTATANIASGVDFTGFNQLFQVSVDGGTTWKLITLNTDTTKATPSSLTGTATALQGAQNIVDAINTALAGGTAMAATASLVTNAGLNSYSVKLTSNTVGGASKIQVQGNTVPLGDALATNKVLNGLQTGVQTSDADLGFGISGASFTTAGIAAETASANLTSAAPKNFVIDSGGASQALTTLTNPATALAFNALLYGNDSQAITLSANDANGNQQSTTITLKNLATGVAGDNQAGRNIDQAVSYINQQLQASNNATLQKIVAVKQNVEGVDKINFISSLASFNVGVGSTANGAAGTGDGVNAGVSTNVSAGIVGAGANMAVDTKLGAQAAVVALAAAIAQLGSAQAAVGKGQNQLSYAVSLAQSQITNFSAAESVIRDANVAQQAANLSKAQVLTQASIAAMAQANSAPQAVLSLLRG